MARSHELRRLARLTWWLGPWSPRAVRPSGVRRRAVMLEAGPPSFVYTPADGDIRAAWLISPGLHYDGPDDPRMDRFAAILAATGAIVLSPRSPALCGLQVTADAIALLARAADALAVEPAARGLPLQVVGVSVGSLAALRLAAAREVARLVVIGGYADAGALLASLCGADAEPREPTNGDRDRLRADAPARQPVDPLNRPVAFLTLLDELPVRVHDRARLTAAWRRFVRISWPHAAWKTPGATHHHAAAHAVAREVDRRDRELFLVGCGVLPGAQPLCAAAFARGRHDYLDPRPHVSRVGADVTAIHGRGDTVIPIAQLDALVAALPRTRAVRLGTFAHSGTASMRELLHHLPRLGDEARAFAAVVRAIA